MSKIKIDSKIIGNKNPCYTIAEAGANHDGEIDKAFKLIDGAIESKADSVKFQTYKASKLTTKTAPKYWDDDKPNETQFDVFKKLDSLNNDDWKQIFEYANKKDITCFSTPFDKDSVDLLYSLDVPAFKIASADITDIPLIKHIAAKQLPIFISTGMANDEEIRYAVNSIEDAGNHEIIIMHCITSYPTKPEDANLEMINTLQTQYPEYPIGFSDHTLGTLISVFSTFYGAQCVEKHFTFDNSLKVSPDHKLSLNPKDFRILVEQLRLSFISKGSPQRNLFDAESEAVKYARRSIVSSQKIPKNTVITEDMLDIKRPGTGISPKFFEKVIGSTTSNEIDEDIPIQWTDLTN
ncbi:MAG: N-acetylneuraminate synthase [Thaumarchaeota archaeon]|jgi:sialic acid synthase SpsE|nr:MAG: N-acetylneuraminate synthase [Nitrososphaerota archaeon]